MINGERLWRRLHELGKIGRGEGGGITRFSYTREDQAAKQLIKQYMDEADLVVREDSVGNVIGKRIGTDESLPSVIIGSHIDTVKQGGMFDGALGVIAGIEVLQVLIENDIQLAHTIEVIAFADEEGSRFQFGMIGSRAFTGRLQADDLSREDKDGVTIEVALENIHHEQVDLANVRREKETIKSYIELHIEQGKVLENKNLAVGVVSGIAGPLWLQFNLIGESGHAGATPMNLRKDPVIAFAKIAQKVEEIASHYPDTVATIGKISVEPGGVNIIPNEIGFTLDIRSIDAGVRQRVVEEIKAYVDKVCKSQKIKVKNKLLQDAPPVPCSEDLIQLTKDSCQNLGIETITLPSGAGHDAMQFHERCPIGMIFVRSKDGISHHPDEYSSKTDCILGARVLLSVIKKAASKDG